MESQAMTKIGDRCYQIELLAVSKAEPFALKRGWKKGEEGCLDYVEEYEYAEYREFKTKDAAVKAAREWLAKGDDVFGCVIVDELEYGFEYDDDSHRTWNKLKSWEVAHDEDILEVAR